jgi:hypothetical protein
MFVNDPEPNCLRQGDILRSIPYPLLHADNVRILGRLGEGGEWNPASFEDDEIEHRKLPAWICQMPTRVGFAVVISQCCDIAPQHGKIIQATIAFARLVPIPSAISKDTARLESLRSNKYPLNPDDPGYINYFYVAPHNQLAEQEWIVDYAQVLSIPSSAFPAILKSRVLQMDDDTRIRFKVKLAASYGRILPEEGRLRHPWLMGQIGNEVTPAPATPSVPPLPETPSKT